ncbi:MAG: IS66 family transposase, partial [Rubrivivax sp.]
MAALDPHTRQAVLSLMAEVQAKSELLVQRDREAVFKQTLIEKLTHEVALLKRLKFAASSERFAS